MSTKHEKHPSGLTNEEWHFLFWLSEHEGPHLVAFYDRNHVIAKELYHRGLVVLRPGRREDAESCESDYVAVSGQGKKFVGDYMDQVRAFVAGLPDKPQTVKSLSVWLEDQRKRLIYACSEKGGKCGCAMCDREHVRLQMIEKVIAKLNGFEATPVAEVIAGVPSLAAPVNIPFVMESCQNCTTVMEEIHKLRTEIDCRIEHGAESGGHLTYVLGKLDEILNKKRRSGE